MAGGEAPRSVLFLCTSNILRSPMAAGLLRRRLRTIDRIESAGLRPGEEVDALAVAVMDELGVDLAEHRPRALESLAEEPPFDLVISLSPEAHHRALDLLPALAEAEEYWPTFDPSITEGSREQRLMEYRSVRDGLDRRIAERFPRPVAG